MTTGFDAAAQIHPVDVRYAPTHTEVELDVRGSRHRFRYLHRMSRRKNYCLHALLYPSGSRRLHRQHLP